MFRLCLSLYKYTFSCGNFAILLASSVLAATISHLRRTWRHYFRASGRFATEGSHRKLREEDGACGTVEARWWQCLRGRRGRTMPRAFLLTHRRYELPRGEWSVLVGEDAVEDWGTAPTSTAVC
ncbi:hypothetical protein J6590_005495 [Homalodisca vitripennis]|nr:hypothetical protein J6590_005495 [Homalodisca vitripennis]